MLKDHSDSERKPIAATTLAILSDWQQGFFYMHHPTDRIAYTTALYVSREALTEMRNVSSMRD